MFKYKILANPCCAELYVGMYTHIASPGLNGSALFFLIYKVALHVIRDASHINTIYKLGTDGALVGHQGAARQFLCALLLCVCGPVYRQI